LSLIRWSTKRARGDPEGVAKKLASRGEGEGTVVVSHGPGDALLRFSIILRPAKARQPELLRLIIAFSTSEGIRKDTGVITWLRWPDKVVVGRRVVATTSTASSSATHPRWVVLTSNIRTGRTDGGDDGSTSLLDVLGVEVDPGLLVERVLESLSWMYYGWTRGMNDHIVARYRSMLDTIGRRVQIDDHARLRVGSARDVDEAGNLIVELQSGEESIKVEDAGRLKEL
jgi:BirA family biotin operon repressor/biotin-[acetyl-CoA-carboxylase] ligase